MKLLFTFLGYLLFCIKAQSQNPVSRIITNQSGLPSNTVYNILQDSKGFVWLGHDKGLSRYDGNSFTHFKAPAQQGKSVSNLLEINNSIWCQDFSGNFYATENEILKKIQNFKTAGTYSPAGVILKNIVSVINYDSLRSYNTKNNQSFSLPTNLNPKQAVFHDSSNSYFLFPTTLQSFNGNKVNTILSFSKPLPEYSFLIKINNNFFGFKRTGFPLAHKLSENKIEPLAVLNNDIQIQDITIIEDEVWISTTSGAYCFNKNLEPLYNGFCFFAENSITKIIKDRENNYWFGTLNKGVLIVPDINVKLFKFGGESISALSSYKDNEIIAGTSSNLLFSFNNEKNKFNNLISNQTKNEIFSLYYDKPINTIITCSNGISFFENEKKIKENSIAGKSFTKLNEETYVVAFAGGVMLLPRKNNNLKIPSWLNDKLFVKDDRYYLTEDSRGRVVLFDEASNTLYTATAQGLKFYNATGSKFIYLNNSPIYASTLCMINNVLYAGTFSDGLIKIKDNKATLINSKEIILATTINKLYSDGLYLWISGDDEIQRYQTITNEVVRFTAADGLPKAEVKDLLVQNGKVFVATTEGLVLFNTNKNSINNVKPILLINKFLVNDISKNINENIQLKANENNIDITFSLISFKDNEACKLSYRLNNNEWKTLSKGIRKLQLASLASGDYTLEIKAENEDNIATEKNTIIRFTIATPFYKTIWFYILLVLFTFGIFYYYTQQKLKNERKNNELLSQKIKLEHELHQSMLSSIKSQMNPHFLFNALNTIQSYIYTNEKENASLYLGKFSELTRTILDMSNKEKVSISEEIKALKLYVELEALRFEEKLNYTFEIDKKISTETIYIPSMLIQPYIENSIKHGLMHQKNKWELLIKFTLKENIIEVIIDDNGVGRKASEAINKQRAKGYQSFAINANEKRLNILNKGLKQSISINIIDKTDAFGYAQGTTMILNIPFLKDL